MLAELLHVEPWLYLLAIVLAASALVTWFSPYALCRGRWPVQDHHLPKVARHWAKRMGVKIYFVDSFPTDDYAFSCFLGLQRVIVMSHVFYHHAPTASVRFVFAHELGHHHLNHVITRFLIRWLWLDCTRLGRRWIDRQELDANLWAEALTGLPRSVTWGVGVPKPAAGGSGEIEERA